MTYKHKNQKGFGALEVIIAIFIIVVGLLAVFGMSSRYLKTANYLKMKLTASFLAQEGVEAVRYIREINSDWGDWIWYKDPASGGKSIGSSEAYRAQYNSADFLAYTDTRLLINSGFYQYTSGTNSPFLRKVTLTRLGDNEVKVEVEVKWQDSTGWQVISAEDRLWNWR